MQITDLILNSSLVAKLILLLLLIISVVSWGFIFSKYFAFKRSKNRNAQFDNHFWNSQDLVKMYNEMDKSPKGALARIFHTGMHDFLQEMQQRPNNVNLPAVERAMQVTAQREVNNLQRHMNFLASTGSVSPYIGLLGTVWGVMTAFIGLSSQVQNTITTVAPGIAEALIATAVGLFAAIPAVVAYNYFAHHIDLMQDDMDNFIDEFVNVLQRQITPNSGA